MGYGQFMPSSYREYAKDFDGDKAVDIWDNPVDAIGSVANYFVRHGWKLDQPVVTRARVSKGYDRDIMNDSLKPKRTVAEFKQLGFTPVEAMDAAAMATAMKLKGEHGTEFWMGMKNFYAITRYNHSRLYAMAVYQLSQEIERKMKLVATDDGKKTG
jgi:peptidoglycan lytic transglycosylase B